MKQRPSKPLELATPLSFLAIRIQKETRCFQTAAGEHDNFR